MGVISGIETGEAARESFDAIIDRVKRARPDAAIGGVIIEKEMPKGLELLIGGRMDPSFGRTITFGLSPAAEVRAEMIEYRPGGVRFRVGDSLWFEAPLEGVHGVMNLLAGIAVAGLFDIEPRKLVEAARSLEAAGGRGRRLAHRGITVFDDCYNSNPEAAQRMLELLRTEPARRRIAVLGEMLELGRWSESLHREVGRHVALCGIHMLIGIRGAACHMVDEAVKAGLSRGAAFFFDDPAEAGEFLRGKAREGDAVLFKGSRGTRVELALERFLN